MVASDQIEHVTTVHDAEKIEHEEGQTIVQALSETTVFTISVINVEKVIEYSIMIKKP